LDPERRIIDGCGRGVHAPPSLSREVFVGQYTVPVMGWARHSVGNTPAVLNPLDADK
jgi:hypothetical protein